MKIISNPFHIRASEYFDSEELFIKLFSPEILDVLDKGTIWQTVNIIRSTPGCGKTTLLRIFTPSILTLIERRNRQDDHYSLLYEKLYELDVFNLNGPNVISSLISFNDEYSSLEDLEISSVNKRRLFIALLNTRLILSLLRSICEIKQLTFPEDLMKIKFDNKDLNFIKNLNIGQTGMDYYNWACLNEEAIINEIDSVYPVNVTKIKGEEELFVLKLFNASNLKIENHPINNKILFMMDDVHNLSQNQRQLLFKLVIEMRAPVNVWISERRQAMTSEEIFSLGNIEGRDENKIDLEQYWTKGKKFENFTKSVSNKRIDSATEGQLSNFEGCLSSNFDSKTIKNIEETLRNLSNKLEKDYGASNVYSKWIDIKKKQTGSSYDKLVGWRSLDILLQRERNIQNSFEFIQLEKENLEKQDGSDVKNAAKLFLKNEYNLPYYFGFNMISKLASYNVEQFLGIASSLFEEIISAKIHKIINNNVKLEIRPEKQEEIIKKLSTKYWENISIRVPDSFEVKTFLDAIGKFCYSETYLPNAPISPGINGIAISMEDFDKLRKIVINQPKSPYYKLAKCISTCISYNLMEYRLNYKCKNREWLVLYLNRLLCPHFELPLDYGGFREKKLSELTIWVTAGYVKPKELWN